MGDSQPLEACGFGFGDVVLMELLKEYSKLPTLKQLTENECDIVISSLYLNTNNDNTSNSSETSTSIEATSSNMHGEAIQLANMLREEGLKVELVLEPKKMKWVLKHALKKNSPYLALIGPDEWYNQGGSNNRSTVDNTSNTDNVDSSTDNTGNSNDSNIDSDNSSSADATTAMNHCIVIKDLNSETQSVVPLKDLSKWAKQYLNK